jgi:hypothetical protein
MNVLQLVFGLTYSNLSVYLRYGISLILETFCDDPLAKVSIPPAEEIETFKAVFDERHPLLNDCRARIDGLKLYLQLSGNAEIQELYYSRWAHDHYATLVFCFCPDGPIPIGYLMSPDVCTIVRLQSLVKYTTNWRMGFGQRVQCAVLTLHSGMWI